MWRKIKDTSYYIDITIDNHYEVFITDFVKIWTYSYSQELFIQCLLNTEDNYGLEIDTEELLDKGTKILLSPEKLQYAHIYERQSFLIVNLTLDFGFQLSLDINLVPGSAELFFLKVAQPLLNIVRDLKESENELRELIAKKDEEITEYKTQGGKIKYTALKPYNDKEHMNKHQCYSNFFNSIIDPQNVLNKTINKCPRRPGREAEQLPTEDTSIKTELSSETVASSQANNHVTIKGEPTDNITKKSSETVTLNQVNNPTTTEEPTDRIPVKVEPSSEIVDSSQANNWVTPTTEVEVKNEFRPFVPKKKRLNI